MNLPISNYHGLMVVMSRERHPFAFEYYDQRNLPADKAAYPLFIQEVDELYALQNEYDAVVSLLEIDKPPAFRAAEEKARAFVGRIGLKNLAPIHLLGEHKALGLLGLDEPPSVAAVSEWLPDAIYVRGSRIFDYYDGEDETEMAARLVHELIHTAAPAVEPLTLRMTEDTGILTVNNCFRSGFCTEGTKGQRGLFFEEGCAEYFAGLYKRSKKESTVQALSFSDRPSLNLPLHYQRRSISGQFDDYHVSGPDGYAIELLAYGAEQRDIMTATDFILDLMPTRSANPDAEALRSFARTIEAIQPGLYTTLRDLPYGQMYWQAGLGRVYSAVTSGLAA